MIPPPPAQNISTHKPWSILVSIQKIPHLSNSIVKFPVRCSTDLRFFHGQLWIVQEQLCGVGILSVLLGLTSSCCCFWEAGVFELALLLHVDSCCVSENVLLSVNLTAVPLRYHAELTSFCFFFFFCNSIGQRVFVGYDVIIGTVKSSVSRVVVSTC